MTNPTTAQAQNQGCELAHPIYDLLEHVKGPVLQIQSSRVSMTQGTNRISTKSPCEGSVLMVEQKPEASSQINDSMQ